MFYGFKIKIMVQKIKDRLTDFLIGLIFVLLTAILGGVGYIIKTNDDWRRDAIKHMNANSWALIEDPDTSPETRKALIEMVIQNRGAKQ